MSLNLLALHQTPRKKRCAGAELAVRSHWALIYISTLLQENDIICNDFWGAALHEPSSPRKYHECYLNGPALVLRGGPSSRQMIQIASPVYVLHGRGGRSHPGRVGKV